MEQLQHFINGQWIADPYGNRVDVFNPATGDAYAYFQEASAKTVQQAYAAAEAAFPAWSGLPAAERGAWLRRLAQGIADRFEEFVEAESRDAGKPLSLSRSVDIPRAISNFNFFADAATQFASESHAIPGKVINYTLRYPLGPVACISPWNLPLYLFTWKIAPALAVGNTVVAKPSEVTPFTAYLLADVAREIDFPAGVLNIVHGTGPVTGQAIVDNPKLKALSFTGGTATGQHLAKLLAPRLVKYSLELGGKNPVLIFEDCNLEKAVETTIRSSFANSGQICLCGSRIYVEESVYARFRALFLAKVKTLRVGNQTSNANMGPVVSKAHRAKIRSYLHIAKREGASLFVGGSGVGDLTGVELQDFIDGDAGTSGYYLPPVVLEGLTQDSACIREEIFGPVVSIQSFSSEEEALQLANDTGYGLAAVIWSNNINRSLRLGESLKAGIVWVNTWLNRDLRTPFGGMGQSGYGREGGQEALRFFTDVKNVCIAH